MAGPLLSFIESKTQEILREKNVKKISIVRKSDHFLNGDIVIPNGCLGKLEKKVLDELKEKIFEELKLGGQPVSKVGRDEMNCVVVYLDRNRVFRDTVSMVMKERHNYGSYKKKRDEKILLCNEVLMGTDAERREAVSLESLRSLLIQDHMLHLLRNQSYTVSSLVGSRFGMYENLISRFGIDLSSFMVASPDIQKQKSMESNFIQCTYVRQSKEVKPMRTVSDEIRERKTILEDAYDFDMKGYIQEKSLNVRRTGFDKNLSLCTVFSSGSPTEVFKKSLLIYNSLQENKAHSCIHITGQRNAFSRQKVHLILQELEEMNNKTTLQSHFLYGPVTYKAKSVETGRGIADDLFRLRFAQLKQAAILKHGENVHGQHWAATLESLTAACIKFELLSCAPKSTVKVNFCEDDMEKSSSAFTTGSFVMYNCARLATLFHHFEKEIECGTYPPLPHVSEVDFSTLTEEIHKSVSILIVVTGCKHSMMYGQIHVCVRELVEEKFGLHAWKSILLKSELNEDDHFLVFHKYEDAVTFKLIGAVCEILEVDLQVLLEIFGEYFLQYCLRHGYDKMLKTLGSTFKSFIQNLDSLHALLALTYKNIIAPSFRCETNEDGSLSLHYYTVRPGLYPIVLGLVKAVARELYNQDAEICVVEKSQEEIFGGKKQEHVIFRVVLTRQDDDKLVSEFKPLFPSGILISAEQFCKAFPYHIIFDSSLVIKQCGMMIQRLLRNQTIGQNMYDIFELTHPRMHMAVVNIRMFINAVFMLKVRVPRRARNKDDETRPLILKGQMMWMDDIKHMIFISSPRLSSLTELMEMNVFLADIPLYDVTRELVLLNQQRIAEIDIAKRLDETTIELRKISQALEDEKKKTDSLLYQMLPEKVAIELKNGRPVPAEKFEEVTVLFSDIVTFTTIASVCPAISIVQMLNDLYNRFDARTTDHGVYKVETIGDAYMVVSGVPVETTKHAEPVANFAIDMVTEATKVLSPATGKPLQIRVGIHSGPVVAGVVGQKMPRYCLFGDTVNIASRMESHGVQGRIHVSQRTVKLLQESKQYTFRCRGEIVVKGKGKMTTFFLIGTKHKLVKEPDDDLKSLSSMAEEDRAPGITYPRGLNQFSEEKSTTCLIV